MGSPTENAHMLNVRRASSGHQADLLQGGNDHVYLGRTSCTVLSLGLI